jgi:hypothetical protein
MKKLLLVVSFCLPAMAVLAQNDCASAMSITASTYVVSAVDGSQVPLPLCVGSDPATAGKWYAYTPGADYSLTVTTDLPVNAGKDTRLHVYMGSCANLVCVAGDDDSGSGWLAVATFNVYAGTTYYIAFDDAWDASGFVFQLQEAPPTQELLSFTQMTLPVVGQVKCVVDMNGDFLDDVVRVTASSITILHQQPAPQGGFAATVIPTETAAHTPSWSIAAGDVTGNGYNDLLYGGGSGTSFMIANNNGTAFTQQTGPEYVFSQRTNFIDINNDGHLDAFVCHDVQPNVYYINDGAGTLVFNQGGLGDTPDGGNYGSIWVDYDNDGDMDLFLAKCRGGNSVANINQMHRNNGDGTFTEVGAMLGLDDNIQTWSAAWGDFDNDGDMDVMIGAYSFVNGGHKLLRNDGDGVFTDVTAGSGFDQIPQTGIENITHDFNNDGYLDIFGAGNVIMVNNGDFTFTPSPAPMNHGPVGDLNNDGFLDIVNNNIAYMNVPNNNNYVKFNVIGSVSNYNGIGARVMVTSALGTQIREVRSGEGFANMSSLNIHFGLGQDTEIDEVRIIWPSGVVDVLYGQSVNSTITVLEGSTGTVGIGELEVVAVDVYPSPADNILFVRSGGSTGNLPAWIFDMGGRMVVQKPIINGQVDVSGLAPGTYLLHMVVDGELARRKFTKL